MPYLPLAFQRYFIYSNTKFTVQSKSIETKSGMSTEEKIEEQRKKVLDDQSKVTLFAPCRIGEGILQLTDQEWKEAEQQFRKSDASPMYFIPASGSGSRMFDFLFDFLNQPNSSDIAALERFMNHIQEFAFYQLLPNDLKTKIRENSIDAEELANYLLNKAGLDFGNLPKGLIPFHYNEPFVLNPFQEHVLQGTQLSNGKAKFHFTVQPEFEEKIKISISNLEGLTGKKYAVSYSTQSKESDSTAFDNQGNVALSDGHQIFRPAGHGALLENLNQLDEELIFIKNIDNVQHFNSSNHSTSTWAVLGGILQRLRSDLKKIQEQPDKQKLIEINEIHQFLSPSELNAIRSEKDIQQIINRPVRVCGMVRNEGQAGGGPFWIDDNGMISKQIVEKTQISLYGEQFRLMVKSTHFNPVMIALTTRDLNDRKIDLMQFRDDSKYFIVNKTQKGQDIKYIELPGLWNGGMAHWNTLFVEISQKTFSPVKTVLDLLEEGHRK